jgi:tRNA-specific 2-thiouridylase
MNSLGFDKPESQTRVVVAMSGGVDSSVVAALLHSQGYAVIGITLQLYDHGAMVGKKGACCAGQDIHDARRVADSLGIPHYVLNYESKFKESVMEDFADTYLAGATPVPCIRCNQSVKFKDLLATARDLGADCMATGHYVQRMVNEAGQAELHRGVDPDKDQSYFLFATTQEQLDFLRFPLGGLRKEETRALATKFNLAVSEKPDSQDICFVPTGGYAAVIEKIRPGSAEPGEIMHIDGRVLGAHAGIIHYTIGQRKGLGGGSGEPLYVVKLDAVNKRVMVGPREALSQKEFSIKELNWLGNPLPRRGRVGVGADTPCGDTHMNATDVASGAPLPSSPLVGEVKVKMRSAQPPVAATIIPASDRKASITLETPYEGVAPGQACVVYAGNRVLGGGWITA